MSNTTKRMGGLSVILVLVFALGAAFGLRTSETHKAEADSGTGGNDSSVDSKCTSKVHYFAYEGKGINFGEGRVFSSVAEAEERFKMKMCSDPLFAAATIHFVNDGYEMSDEKAERQARRFVKHRKAWKQAVAALLGDVEYKLVNINEKYATLGMVKGETPMTMPDLVKFAAPRKVGQALQLTVKSTGAKRLLRTLCDLQPSVVKGFPQVSPPADKPMPKPTKKPKPKPEPDCKVRCDEGGGGCDDCDGLDKKDYTQGTQARGNNKPGGGGKAPTQTDPVGPPAGGNPPVTYTPPPKPKPEPTQTTPPRPAPTHPPQGGDGGGNHDNPKDSDPGMP